MLLYRSHFCSATWYAMPCTMLTAHAGAHLQVMIAIINIKA